MYHRHAVRGYGCADTGTHAAALVGANATIEGEYFGNAAADELTTNSLALLKIAYSPLGRLARFDMVQVVL